MADILSPAVVTTEKDLSYVAPSISTSIAALIGAAKKGPVNSPQYVTTPAQFIDVFGEPVIEGFGGQAALLYLQQANMLWYSRVASRKGSDPVATANTDTRATLAQTDATAFVVPSDLNRLSGKELRLRFDGDTSKDITIQFTAPVIASLIRATIGDTMTAFVNFVNNKLSGNDTFEPRYGYAASASATPAGRKITVETQSKDGPGSAVSVLIPTGTDAASEFGWSSGVTEARGQKTILVATAMEPAKIESAAVGGGGTFNLGTAATATSGNAETYNLGDVAVARMVDPAGSAVWSFTPGMQFTTLANMNGPTSAILANYQAIYAFDPTVALVLDGYTVTPTIPVLGLTVGAVTVGDLQDIADAINAACPAGLGPIAYVRNTGNPATTYITISSRGKYAGYSYMQIGTPPDVPQNNTAAAALIGFFIGLQPFPETIIKVGNTVNVYRDGATIPLSFDYATLAAQGYRPEWLTGAQLAAAANGQAGFDLVSNTSGLTELITGGVAGKNGYVWCEGYGTYFPVSGGPGTALVTDSNGNTIPSTTATPLMRDRFTFCDSTRRVGDPAVLTNPARAYIEFTLAGGGSALVRVDSLQTSEIPWDAQGLTVEYVTGTMNVTPAQKASFINALKAAGILWHCITSTRGPGIYLVTTMNDWAPAAPAAGDAISWGVSTGYVVSEIDRNATCGTEFGTGANNFGGATPNFRRQLLIHVVSGAAPAAGDALTSGANTGTARAVFRNGDLQLYFHNNPAITLAGVAVTGIGAIDVSAVESSLGAEFDGSSGIDITDDGAGTYDIGTPSENRGGAFPVPAPNTYNVEGLESLNGRVLRSVIRFTDGIDELFGVIQVVPAGGSWATDSFPSTTFNGPSVAGYPLVDVVTVAPINGHDILVDTVGPTASYGAVVHQEGIAPGNVADYDVVLALRNVRIDGMPGWYPNKVLISFTIASSTMGHVVSAAPAEQAGVTFPVASYVYNPLTATHALGSFISDFYADAGEGFNELALLVDGTWSVAIDFNSYAFAVRTAATASEVADAINSKARAVDPSLDGIASVSTASVKLTSRTKGASSSLRAVVDNAALDFSAILTAVTGTGDPTFSAALDGGSEVAVDFGDYVGDLISNQGAATPAEVAAALKRAFGVGDTQCYVDGAGASRRVVLAGSIDGSGGEIEVVEENSSLGGNFGVVGTYNGTETTVAAATFYGISPGTWANNDEDHVKLRFTDEDPLFYAPNTSRVDIIVNDSIEETYREVSPNPNADGKSGTTGTGYFIETIIGNAASVGNGRNPSTICYTNYDEDYSTPAKEYTGGKFIETPVGGEYELSGGADGIDALDEYDYLGVAYDAVTGGPTGLKVWEDVDARFINIVATPGITYPSVINEMLRICESRADCMAIIDPPIGLTPQQLVDWHNGRGFGNTAAFNSSWGALYNTWILYADPYNQVDVWLPPSCFVVAVYAYNDKVSEPWFAPAGLTRGKVAGALDLMHTPNLGERNLMYGQGNAINSIVNFSRDGIVVWGQRTLQRLASTLDRVNVRRLVCYLRTISALTTRVFLFDPNDSISRKRIVQALEEIANDVIRRRGLQRAKVVDKTTANDINQKRMKIAFFIEPTQAGEILEIPFILAGAGQAFVDDAA